MKYMFTPSHPGAVAYAYKDGPLIRSGDVVELDAAQAARLLGIVAGANGNPCLIPLDEATGAAAAAFIAAISEPTPHNPETLPPAVSTNVVEPVKRGRGRPPRVPA